MEQPELTAQPRQIAGKRVAALRRAGIIPAVLYGPAIASQSIQIDARQLEQVLGRVGRTGLIALTIDGSRYHAMVHDVHRHPIRGTVEHVDFLRVLLDRPVRVEVPIVLTGESPAVRGGGALIHGLTTLTVEARPGDLPHVLQVDLSQLASVDSALYVRDLPVGDLVRVLDEPDALVARVVPSRVEAEVAGEAAAAAPPTPPPPMPEQPAEGAAPAE